MKTRTFINIFFLIFVQYGVRIALIAWIYQLNELREIVSQKVNLITTLIIILTLNSNLPLQNLLTKRSIAPSDFWLSSVLVAGGSSLIVGHFLELDSTLSSAAFFAWVCFQSISFFYALSYHPKAMQALATVGVSVFTAVGAYLASEDIKIGGDIQWTLAACVWFLLMVKKTNVTRETVKKVVNALKFRLPEAVIVAVFQYSFLLEITNDVNPEGSFTFILLLQIGAMLSAVPNILSSYLLSDFLEKDRRILVTHIALAVLAFSVICLISFWLINSEYLIPALFVFSFGSSGAMRIVSIALVSIGKTHVPFVSNIVHVGIFYFLVNSLGEMNYTSYMVSVVFASLVSAAIFSIMALKWLR